MTRYRRPLLAMLACALTVGACAPLPVGGPVPARGVPGFDTRDYPGDDVMRRWFAASPYRWVGYYLPAPCYTGTTWSGRRSALSQMGWGFAVLFVGEQDWSAMRAAPGDTVPVAEPGARCVTANLTAENGAAHAAAAEVAAAADGFPDATIVFLNVERVERVSPELEAYVRGWVATMLDRGRYTPGLYAHDVNAAELHALVAASSRGADAPSGLASGLPARPASTWAGRPSSPVTPSPQCGRASSIHSRRGTAFPSIST
jgi:hypothetical protein